MAKCPNCGQKTRRTEDWSCQWCGYPLLSGSYKKIEKTYRELKGERLPRQQEAETEYEPSLEIEEEPEEEEVAEEIGAEVLEIEEEPEEEEEIEEEPEEEEEIEEEPEEEEEIEEEPEVKPEPKARRRTVRRRRATTKREPEIEVESVVETRPAPGRKKVSRSESVSPAAPEPVMDVIEITVEELLSAYEEEGAAADARFANQVLRLTGVVDRIEIRDTLDIYYITLKSNESDSIQNVRCTFERSQEPELRQLVPGQKVIVQGNYDGSIIDISMRDCIFID